MSEQRFTSIGAIVARFTRVDGCGRPLYGDKARLVTEGFITIGATANQDETDAVEVRNANGKLIASRPARSKTTGHTLEIALAEVDPELIQFLTLNPTVENGIGQVAGFDLDTDTDPSQGGVAIEVWGEVAVDDVCAEGISVRYDYKVFPFVQGGNLGDFEIGNDAVNFTIGNAVSRKGHDWGEGPYFIDLDADGDPVALAPVASTVTLRELVVSMDPPEPTDGAIPLDDPDAAAATTAVTGTPGHFTPTNSNRPDDLADMTGITASPTTAWTTGQYVETESGSFVHWNGTAWVAGKA
jgi:hypothetical protein